MSNKIEKHSITFQSNLQEELSLNEILSCLQTNKASGLEQKRLLLATIIEKQARIIKAFDGVSRKLAYSFIYCLPKAVPLHRWSEKIAAKTIFKLAVLYDVYKRSLKCNADERVESLFESVVAAVAGAKFEARRRRNWNFCCHVMGMIDIITKDSLAVSGAAQNNNRCGDKSTKGVIAKEDKKRAMRRYRALLGLGDQAINRDQLFRVVSDLVRIDPWIPLHVVTEALDKVLGIENGEAAARED